MAKYKAKINGTISQFLEHLTKEEESFALGDTARLIEREEGDIGKIKYLILAYERYAAMGSGRSSLNVTLLEKDDETSIVATATGGGGGVFLRLNTWSENSFLNAFIDVVNRYDRFTEDQNQEENWKK